jgi:fatty-acyl-CoA synthase
MSSAIDVPLRDWAAFNAGRRPSAIALHCTDTGESRTWAELDARVGALAGGLRALNLTPGDRVGVLADNDVRTFELFLACLRAQLVFTPLNWRLAAPELSAVLDDCRPAALFHDVANAERSADLAGQRRMPTVCWDAPDDAYEELLRSSARVDGEFLDPDALAQITYTSGTSGVPKGVTSANRTLVFHALNMAATSRLAESGGHHLNVLPLFWGGGLNVFSTPMLYWGGRVTTSRQFDEAQTLQWLDDPDLGITHICAAPEMYQRIAALPGFDTATFPTLRCVFTGGWRPDTPALHAAWRERGMYLQIGYGSSETGPNLTVQQSVDPALVDDRSSGTVVPFSRLRLVDADAQDVAPGETGEIWAAGPAITPGYWGRSRAEAFHGEWFRTGDLGRFGPAGDLRIVDRLREIIRSGGTNVYPAEIEQVLIEHPAVREVAVIAVPDERFGQVGLAVVVPADGYTPTLDELTEFCAERLARYKRPRHLVLVDELPRTASDKVARQVLRTRYGQPTANGQPVRA